MKYVFAISALVLAACGSGNPNTSWNTAGTVGMSPGNGLLPPCTMCGSGTGGTTGNGTTGSTGTTGTR